MIHTTRPLAALLVATLLLAPAPAQTGSEDGVTSAEPISDVMMLRLADGGIRWGSILEHSADGLLFRLLDHGGEARVAWGLLDPTFEQELRERYGYVDVSTEEIVVDVERLLLVDGREVTGVILSREGDDYVVKSGGNLQVVPKRRVQSIAKGHRLPALDVYTREELYGMFAAQADLEDIDEQADLARRCEQILDFAHAVEHYQAVLALEPETERAEIEFALERAIAKAEQQEQIDYLRDADLHRKKGRYDEALAALDAFPGLYPRSPLIEDQLKARERLLLLRDDAIREMVRRRWDHWARFLARSRASELDYAGAITYAAEGLGEEIRAKVLEDVQARVSEDVTADQIEAYWATRKKTPFKNASYGFGTWLLGNDKARAGTEGQAREEPKSAKDEQRAKLEEKIERFLKSQRAQQRSRSRADMADDFEAFWTMFRITNRGQWIRAYYVEFGGDHELRDHPTLRNCSSCAGSGVHELLSVGGGSSKEGSGVHLVTCSACRGSGILRRVYYR